MTEGTELLFGKIAVKLGFLTAEALEAVVDLQIRSQPQVSLGLMLVQQGLLTEAQIDEILGLQASGGITSLFGKLLVEHGIVEQRQVNECLRDQELFRRKGYDFKVGELLVKKGHMSAGDLDRILALQGKCQMICPATLTVYNVETDQQPALCPDCMSPLLAKAPA
jgi:hypothetical protein